MPDFHSLDCYADYAAKARSRPLWLVVDCRQIFAKRKLLTVEAAAKERMSDRYAVERALSAAPDWITPEFVERTLRVWQPFYDEPSIPADALEMIRVLIASGLFPGDSRKCLATVRGVRARDGGLLISILPHRELRLPAQDSTSSM